MKNAQGIWFARLFLWMKSPKHPPESSQGMSSAMHYDKVSADSLARFVEDLNVINQPHGPTQMASTRSVPNFPFLIRFGRKARPGGDGIIRGLPFGQCRLHSELLQRGRFDAFHCRMANAAALILSEISGKLVLDEIQSHFKIALNLMQLDSIFLKSLQRKQIGMFIAVNLALVGWLALGGLPVLGQAPSSLAKEMLQPTYPEEFFFAAPPKDVWQALSEEVKLIPSIRVLVSEADDLVLSWVELPDQTTPSLKPKAKPAAISPGSRYGGGMSAVPSNPQTPLLTNDPVRLKEIELAEVGGDKVAVTTVIVLTTPKGSKVRFRRIYYGSHTQPRVAHSTGAYESCLVAQLSKRLAPQPGVK